MDQKTSRFYAHISKGLTEEWRDVTLEMFNTFPITNYKLATILGYSEDMIRCMRYDKTLTLTKPQFISTVAIYEWICEKIPPNDPNRFAHVRNRVSDLKQNYLSVFEEGAVLALWY